MSPVDGRRVESPTPRGVAPAGVADGHQLHVSASAGTPLRFAYADPPYPGMSKRFYSKHKDYKGEVDHTRLIESLRTSYDGWALSTSAKALRDILPLCPPEARVCAWVKPHSVSSLTFGLHNVWEPIIVLQGRRLRPGRVDALVRYPARHGGTLPGRKPIAFCGWLFDAMGMVAGDVLDDMFPGSGVVGRSWAEACRRGSPGDGPLRSAGSGVGVDGRSTSDGSTIAGGDK